MAEDRDRLRVFLSSRMEVLTDLRAMLRKELVRQGLDLFVYEADAGARPHSPEQTSLQELERSDLAVFVLEHTYGEVTEREYDHARTLEKPCLVYVRLRQPAEEPQERFLAKVKGPRGVPSHDTFITAVDLAEKVAGDVQRWLVREFRRLSAAVADQSTSPRQSSQFAADMGRLQTATSIDLQKGGPADLLAWQIRLWFTALEYPLHGEATRDGSFAEFLVRIPERRRFRSVLVRAKDSEVQAPDVVHARSRLNATEAMRVDECWLVASQRVSPAARSAAGEEGPVSVFTFDELIEEDVDFTRYFDWLDSESAREKLDEYYVPLAGSVNEVTADGTPVATSHYDDMGSYVDQWLRDPAAEHISLLGEFGTGKSWFSLMYATKLARQYRDAQRDRTPRPRVPLLVRLRDYARGFKDVGALLTDFVFREREIKVPTYAALQALNRLGRVLFIFDGFDEMAARIDRQKMADNFWAMTAVLGPGSKAMLTCRTEYFQFAQQARDVLGGKLRGSRLRDTTDVSRFQVAELAMFDRPRLERVLSKKAKPHQVKAVLANENLVDLAKRPVMVDLLIEAMPGLDAASANLARVYYLAVTRKMARDIGQQRTFTSMADKMFFMCELSTEMLFTDQMTLHFKAFPDRIRQYFGSGARDIEEDHWHHDLLSQTMLVRNDEGYYKPAHRSLLEFFAAYKLAAEIGALGDDYIDVLRPAQSENNSIPSAAQKWSAFFSGSFTSRHQSTPIARFVREDEERLSSGWGRVKVDRMVFQLIYLLCGEKALRDVLASSGEAPASSKHYVARTIQILRSYGDIRGLALEKAIVHGLHLAHADMSGARLAGTQWEASSLLNVRLDSADLQGARFQNTPFRDVTLREAILTSTEWDERSTVTATISGAAWGRGPRGNVVMVSSADGRFYVVDPMTSRAVEITLPVDSFDTWQNELAGVVDCPPVGPIDFGARPLPLRGISVRGPWRMPLLADGVVMTYEQKTLAPDVDREEVATHDRGRQLVAATFLDASSRGATEEYFTTVAPSGRMLAGLRGSAGRGMLITVTREHGEVFLNATGKYGTTGSFSRDDSLIAISESDSAISIWRTDTGAIVARFAFPVVMTGAKVQDATGLPSGVLNYVRSYPDGWPLGPDGWPVAQRD